MSRPGNTPAFLPSAGTRAGAEAGLGRAEIAALAALTLLPLLPFLGAAISIDAPVFVAVARRII